MDPFISIIVPVYGAEQTLDRCIRSVLEQGYQDYEVILVDDGSSDRSGAICDAYGASDPRVRVIHQGNAGVSAARNTGIRAAKGAYLLFLDSDDALMPCALDHYADAAHSCNADVVIGALSVLEEGREVRTIGPDSTEILGSEIWNRICLDSSIFGYAGGKLVRTEIVKSNDIAFNTAMQSQEDLDFFLSVYGSCQVFHLSDQRLYQYYYGQPKRTPPTWDFIANQLKLARIARERTMVAPEAMGCVQKRILSLLYTGLYTAADDGTFYDVVRRMEQVKGLPEFLEEIPAAGEHRFVAAAFSAKKYKRIYWYFVLRNRVRDGIRKLRGGKTLTR